MPLNQQDHGDQSWWKLSEGWPDTRQFAKEKWVFANKSKLIPYGTYVLDEDASILRVESKKDLDLLNANFDIVRDAILEGVREHA